MNYKTDKDGFTRTPFGWRNNQFLIRPINGISGRVMYWIYNNGSRILSNPPDYNSAVSFKTLKDSKKFVNDTIKSIKIDKHNAKEDVKWQKWYLTSSRWRYCSLACLHLAWSLAIAWG
jgi:hypothetical protein